ncbi:MAG: tRNA lysidine(34) synthetase TilS [Sphingomicrobium sp.]
MSPGPPLLERFRNDLDALIGRGARIGIAVSGGPDSLSLLLLAAAAGPGRIEAATVDHALRPESRDEANMVAAICSRLGVPHRVLTVEWTRKPESAIQERAREERYRLLAGWARDRGLDAIATAHHLDDQAETLLMRLTRGSGVRGLAGMRPASVVPGSDVPLLRPLLGWPRSELEGICAAADIEPARDPSNHDETYERVRVRHALGNAQWLDAESVAASAMNLAQADAALEWATQQEWARAVRNGGAEIVYRPGDAPSEIRRRIVSRAVTSLANEGQGAALRGREVDRLLGVLAGSGTATIRGVRCRGGHEWRFTRAPPRRG